MRTTPMRAMRRSEIVSTASFAGQSANVHSLRPLRARISGREAGAGRLLVTACNRTGPTVLIEKS